MNWQVLFLSVVLVAPAVAESQQPPNSNKELKGQTVTLRACVQPGTHGSMGNLSQVVVARDSTPAEPRRVIYWFFKNLNGFKDHPGQLVEITGTVTEVLDDSLELKATDGVFAEIEFPAASLTASASTAGGAVGTSGGGAPQPVATAGNASVAEADNLPTRVVKAEVTTLRTVGNCR